MLEVVATIVVLAVALTFFSDATSDTAKLIRSVRRRGQVRVATKH